ncbi:MAG: hypothetical protein ACLRS8_02460 [Parabacteroides merdae]
MKIEEIIAKGPLTKADTKIKPGCIIEKIDGTNIKSGEDHYPLAKLAKPGKQVLPSVYDPATEERFEETSQNRSPTTAHNPDLLYKRWVEQKRQMVDKPARTRKDRCHVHVSGMNSESFAIPIPSCCGRCREKEAV